VKDIFCVDLPLLQILHLHRVTFQNGQDFLHLFSKIPNLEELEVTRDQGISKPIMTGKFNRLPKLIRANVNGDVVPLEIVKEVEVLFVDSVMTIRLVCYSFPF